MSLSKISFGSLPDGRLVDLYTLANSSGMTVKIMNYGAIVTSLTAPDRNGVLEDVVLGFDNLDDYLEDHPYFGAVVGRYGNRIARGRFTLDGVEYPLAANDGANHLHGGRRGFDKQVWEAEEIRESSAVGVRLHYRSRDGEEGYPGNLDATVTVLLTEADELRFEYRAETDKPTILNLTHHGYFNLTAGKSDILNHRVMIDADRITVVKEDLIPTGELRVVAGTPWDFTSPQPVGLRMDQVPGGYDHNYVLNGEGGDMVRAARVFEPESGRTLDVFTTEPGLQFYGGNFLDGSIAGKNGVVYERHWGFCMETQHFPDSPNQPSFPSVVLRPGETYHHLTVFKFGAR